MNLKTTDIEHLSSSQYSSTDKLNARWDLYESAEPKIDMHQTGIEHLSFKGKESILEVGCGDGGVLIKLRQRGHTGKLIGLDISDRMFAGSVQIQQKERFSTPIEFIIGSADSLPFSNKTFDTILSFFMLYHMPDVQKTLLEWKRVLKDDGKVLIATGSERNKPKHMTFKKMIAPLVGQTASPRMSSSFNLENAKSQLDGIFKIAETFVYDGKIRVKSPEQYLKAFRSVRDMYTPLPSDDLWGIAESMVRAEIEKEIREDGFFTDLVRRTFFICEKI